MPALQSKLNPRSEEFKASALQMRQLVGDLNARLAKVAEGGGEKGVMKQPAADTGAGGDKQSQGNGLVVILPPLRVRPGNAADHILQDQGNGRS